MYDFHYYRKTLCHRFKSQFPFDCRTNGYRPDSKGVHIFHQVKTDGIECLCHRFEQPDRRCWISNVISFVLQPMTNVINTVCCIYQPMANMSYTICFVWVGVSMTSKFCHMLLFFNRWYVLVLSSVIYIYNQWFKTNNRWKN